MDEPTIETLATRLGKVERENRWLKGLSVVVLVGLVTVVVMLTNSNSAGTLIPRNRVIEAQKFVLKDSNGAVQAILGEATLGPPSAPAYGLFFFDQHGNGAELTDRGLYLNSDFAEAGFSTQQLYMSRFKRSREEIHKETEKVVLEKPKAQGSRSQGIKIAREILETQGSFSLTVLGTGANLLLAGEQSASKAPWQNSIKPYNKSR